MQKGFGSFIPAGSRIRGNERRKMQEMKTAKSGRNPAVWPRFTVLIPDSQKCKIYAKKLLTNKNAFSIITYASEMT